MRYPAQEVDQSWGQYPIGGKEWQRLEQATREHIGPIEDQILTIDVGNTNTVLGLFDIAPFSEGEAEMNAGDILVILN